MTKKILLLITVIAIALTACKKTDTKIEKKPDEDSITVVTGVDTVHTPQNSVNWEGVYKGITPCEDCDGVETTVILNFDFTFTQSLRYIGKGGPYESKGTFSWDESGGIITLKFTDDSEAKYRVGEGTISLLNSDGSVIEGEDYVLKK